MQTAASTLENLLVDLYNDLLGQPPPARQKGLVKAIEQVGNGQPLGRLADQVTNLESLAAVMKFRTFSFMCDNQTLEMQMGGLRNSVTGLEGALHRLRPERDALKAEVDRLTAELETLRQRLAVLEGEQPAPELSWFDRVINYFKGWHRD